MYLYIYIYISLKNKNNNKKKLTLNTYSMLYVISYSGQLNQGVWNLQQNIKDEEMLSKSLPFVIESGLANSTNKKYFHGWKA